jgi:hypothetical protein
MRHVWLQFGLCCIGLASAIFAGCEFNSYFSTAGKISGHAYFAQWEKTDARRSRLVRLVIVPRGVRVPAVTNSPPSSALRLPKGLVFRGKALYVDGREVPPDRKHCVLLLHPEGYVVPVRISDADAESISARSIETLDQLAVWEPIQKAIAAALPDADGETSRRAGEEPASVIGIK